MSSYFICVHLFINSNLSNVVAVCGIPAVCNELHNRLESVSYLSNRLLLLKISTETQFGVEVHRKNIKSYTYASNHIMTCMKS